MHEAANGGELISCALFCYNQAEFIAKAVESVLAQDYSPLEVVLSDDASTDGSADVIRSIAATYRGPHTLVVNVNPRNLGLAAHVNLVTRLCSGRLIVAAAGDDQSLPQRARTLYEAWVRAGKRAQSLYSACYIMDRAGCGHQVGVRRAHDRFWDRPYVAANGGWVHGATEAWTKDLFETFGPLDDSLLQEDHAIHFRAAMLGGVVFVEEPLVRYRWDVGSWREVRHSAAGTRARRREFQQMCRLECLNAAQAERDLGVLGDASLLILGRDRSARARAMVAYSQGMPWSVPALWRLWRSGISARAVAVKCLGPQVPGCLTLIGALRRIKAWVCARGHTP